jgi:hypothetical protein
MSTFQNYAKPRKLISLTEFLNSCQKRTSTVGFPPRRRFNRPLMILREKPLHFSSDLEKRVKWKLYLNSLESLFHLHNAQSAAFEDHETGNVAFVTNGLGDNGVQGFVEPLPRDKVFGFLGIALSTFCEATVQIPPFIARGNGGSGVKVLEPKEKMTASQLASIAACINTTLRWRFSWYRQITRDRVRNLPVSVDTVQYSVSDLLPRLRPSTLPSWNATFAPMSLESIYELEPGDYHSVERLESGSVPLISCGDTDNGIIGFYDIPLKKTYEGRLTVAFNGSPLTAKYHPYTFAAKDDVAVCSPRKELKLTTQLLIQLILNRERWRYSYYRKCFMDKLRRFRILLPAKSGAIDEEAAEQIMATSPYWDFLKTQLEGKT